MNYSNSINYGDSLHSLPVDETPPTPVEANILNKIFSEDRKNGNRLQREVKEIAGLIVLFIIVCSEPFKKFLAKFVPSVEKSQYIDIAIRGVILAISFYIFKNMFLMKKD